MRLKSLSILLLSAGLAACAQSTQPVAVAPASPMFDVEALKTITQTLSSDAFEGRAPMTAAETKTIAFIAEQFAAAGLQPGNGDRWFQDVPLVEITADAARADLLFSKNGKTVLRAKYGDDAMVWTKRVVDHVAVEDSELVFVGYGIHAPEKGWNDYAGIDVAGKTVVILVNDPDWQTPDLSGEFGGRAMTYYGRWTYKYEEAARQGAAAAIIVHDTEPAAYGWDIVRNSNRGAKIDMDRADGGMGRVAIEGWIQKHVAETLFKAAGQDFNALSNAAKSRDFNAVKLGVTVSGELYNVIRKASSKNVIGVLPGRERADESLLYTAHWDHLGRCGADANGDDICNGALDNATGIAGLVSLAKAHAAAGPARRSIQFLAVTAEESGLLGSAYYGEQPLVPLASTVAGINMDGLNIVAPTHDIIVVGAGKSELEAYLETEAEAQSRRVEAEPTPEKGYYYRSDHFSLAKKGVPMLYTEVGIDVIGKGKAFGQAAQDDYTKHRYHQPGDEYDPDWNWEGAVQDLSLFYHVGRRLAESDVWPNWRAGDEFRAIRDASRAGAAQ